MVALILKDGAIYFTILLSVGYTFKFISQECSASLRILKYTVLAPSFLHYTMTSRLI